MRTYSEVVSQLMSDFALHVPYSNDYNALEAELKKIGQHELDASIMGNRLFVISISKDLEIVWPYHSMGAVSTVDLLRIDELVMFSYYMINISRYKRAFDLGANLGLHSLFLSALRIPVVAYEPDPHHFLKLQENTILNRSQKIELRNAAVAGKSGSLDFLRIIGNTTSSHIKGLKKNPYGEMEVIVVECDELNGVLDGNEATLLKIDVEGMEAELIANIASDKWDKIDAFIEIGTPENSQMIFEYCMNNEIKIFAQSQRWNQIGTFNDMPLNYKDGSIFLSRNDMNWKSFK